MTDARVSLTSRVDSAFKAGESIDDMFLQSHYSRYLVILTSGYIEVYIQETNKQYAHRRANAYIAEFVHSATKRYLSLNHEKIVAIMGRFDSKTSKAFSDSLDEKYVSAVNSLKARRDEIAHGKSSGISYSVIKEYYLSIKSYVRSYSAFIDRL